jgi:hypothetical protein
VLTFSFNPELLCNQNSNKQQQGNNNEAAVCEDCEPLTSTTDPVTVQCVADSDGTALLVEPLTALPGATFTVSNPSSGDGGSGGLLPDKINCNIVDGTGTKIQSNLIDTSGNVQLDLKDCFGMMRLEACDQKSCVETLCYLVDNENTGTVDMAITQVDFTFNGETFNPLSCVEINPLVPNDSASLEPKLDVDICGTEEFCAEVDVEADPPNGNTCRYSEEYKFDVNPSQNQPICRHLSWSRRAHLALRPNWDQHRLSRFRHCLPRRHLLQR